MKVTFGLRLDARQGPLLESRVNEAVVGRQGLLGLLETHTGLAGPAVPRPQRVAAYLGCLRRCDNGARFYSGSLQVDEMGVASELLAWRDEWLLHGWNGQAPAGAIQRVADMAGVEQVASGAVPPGEAERLQLVAQALKRRKVPVTEVRLLDALDRFPKAWQAVLSLLPTAEIPAVSPSAVGGLGALQASALASLTSGVVEFVADVANDGSVLVYQGESREAAQHWLSAWCLAENVDRIILCEREGASLDATLKVTGVAACGFDESSPFRPALQAIGLALELLWKPVDAHRVMEFLTHPYGPFARRARFRLAGAYSQQPGFGGEAWAAARHDIGQLDNGAHVLEQVQFWFDAQRWSREEGAPLDEVLERVRRVGQTLRALLGAERDDLPAVGAAAVQCDELTTALLELGRQGITKLSPRHLEQLLAQATASGAGNPLTHPEVGCLRSAVSTSVAALEPANEVIWWMPSTPSLPVPLPWSPMEVAALFACGAQLRDPAAEMKALAEEWLRPLLAARKRFVLVLPSKQEEEHPIWQLIHRVMPQLSVRPLDQELLNPSPLAMQVSDKPLPPLEATLHVTAPMQSRRDKQSYTSLSELFDHPAIAVMKDAADLRTGALLSVEAENRLVGTLAHRLIEQLLEAPGVLNWSADQVRDWFRVNAEPLIEAEGAPLLMRGFGVALHRFKTNACEAAVALLAHLRAAGATSVQTEVELEGVLRDVPIVGKVDLLIELPASRRVALDLKWARPEHYANIITAGTHLQLALYSSLIEQKFGTAPVELGYFIFEGRTLLATGNSVFPGARVCSPPADATVQQLLSKAHASWVWRTSQLADGVVEVVDEMLGILEDFEGPPGTFPVSWTGKWNNDYAALLGWGLDE